MLALCLSSLKKCLFSSSAHILIKLLAGLLFLLFAIELSEFFIILNIDPLLEI